MSGAARELGELIYQLGIQHQKVHQELAQNIGKQLAKAFDDGFALGRETGYQDAARDVPADGVEVIVVDGTLPALMPPPDPKAN
jgi:hypothetical protein